MTRHVIAAKRLFLCSLYSVLLGLSITANADGDKELCYQHPLGGRVTLTVEACPVTDNESFHRSYWTQLDGTMGEGCWMGDRDVTLVIWENHPYAFYPFPEFKECYGL
jgi:hypothetical protein